MGIRRFTQIATSDDEGEAAPPPSRQNSQKRKKNAAWRGLRRRRRRGGAAESGGRGEWWREAEGGIGRRKKRWKRWSRKRNPRPGRRRSKMSRREDAKPVGDVVREDPVLLVPAEPNQKPYVAIIKDISQTSKGSMMVTGQWFYRPEEAESRTGANWPSRDTRELFYSFHRDEVPAESVMHKCVVHFIPLNKQIPNRKQHPGFFVQRVYDTEQMNLFKLTDKDYEDNKQHEIDLLVQKTLSRLGDLPDIVLEDAAAVQEDHFFKSKRLLRKKNIPSLDVSRKDDAPSRNGQFLKAETPGSCVDTASEYFKILSDFNALTGEKHRDKWLEKLLQAIQFMSNPGGSGKDDAKEKGVSDVTDLTSKTSSSNLVNESDENKSNGDANICWPDTAVPAVVAVEKAAHEAFSSDFQKYNQKMRQLSFNFKNNVQLAQRLLNGELEAYQILNMSPNELKMTDARCNRCTEKQVRLLEIIQTGHGDRYQLECGPCGNTWYASRDEVATLTIQEQTARKNVGTEPLVTPKFEDREKLANAHTDEEEGNDVLKKTTEAGLDSQKSPDEARPKDNSAANNAE
nr:SWR1-complex protein 3-like [Ipomoea batatas]